MGNAVSRPSCLGQKSRRPEELRREPRDVGMDVGQPPDPSLPQAWPGSLEKPPGVGKGWSPVPAAPRSGVGSPVLRRSRSEVTVPNGGTPGVLVGGAAVATWTPPPRAGGPRGTWSWKPLTTREVTEVTEVTETIVTEIVEVTEYPMGEPLVTRTVTVLTELVAGQTDAAEGSPRAVPALEVSGGTEQAQDTLESLLAWVADMEELVGNQKPPSAEVKVAKAQLEEQKLLKRLLEERRPRVERVLQDMEHGVVMEHGLGREHESSTEHGLGMEHGSSTEHRSSMGHCLGVEHGSSTEHGSSMEHGSDVAEVSNTGAEHGSDTEHGSGTGHGPSMEHGLDMEHGSGVAHGSDTEHGSGTGHGPNTEHVSDTEPVWAAVPKGLGARWERLVQEAEARSRCLARIVPAAQDFQEALDPFQEWLVATERQLAQLWHPGGCLDRVRDAHQQSQALCQEIRGRLGQLDVALERGQRVLEMVTGEEAVVAQEKLEALRLRYVLVGQSSSDTEQRLRQTLEASSRLGTAQEDLALWLSHMEKELATRDGQTGGQEMVLSDSDREKFQQVLESQRCRSSGLAQRLEEVGQLQLEPPALRAQLAQQKLLSAEVLLHRGLVERLLGVLEPLLGAWPEPLRQQLQWAVRGLREDTEQLCQHCGAVAARLERAQALLEQFSEAQEELEPWLEEAQELGGQLDPHNMDGQDLKEQQALLQCLREAMAEHRPVLGKLERVVVELLELSPLQAAPLQQRWRAAEERYGALRQRLRRATSLLEDTLPRYSQLSERLSLLLESLERVRSRLSIRPSVRGDAGQLRERLRDTGLALAELEELGGGLESVRSQGGDLVGTLRDAGLDTAATGIEERSGELLSLWGSLRCRCQEQEQWLQDLLALAERFWPGLSELALALGDTQHLVLGLEEPGGDPEEIRARLHTMQALREEVDALQGELDALGSLGVELMSHCGDTDRPDVTRSLDELYSSWHNLNKVWGERCARLEEQLQSALSYREALKRLSGWLEAAELRVTQEGTSLLSGDPEMVQQQLAELKEWRRELYQWRVEVESLRHWGGGGQGEPPAPLRDLQRRWDRLEEDLGSRQHQLEAALLGLGQLRHQLEELLAWLGTTAEQLQRPPDPHPDLQTCEIELAKHKVLRNDVLSHARTVQSVTEVGQGLLVATPGDNLEGLQQDLQQLRQRWDLVQSQTETRQLELENTLSQVQDLSLEMTELLQWLEQVELQLCLAPPGWGPPETTKEELATHLELCRALDARQETFGGLRDRLQRLLPPAHAAQPCSTQHTLRLLEHKWSSVQAQAQHRKERLSEGLRLSTEFHGTAQELLRWLTRAEEILGSPEPPSVLLDVVTTQIQEHKALEQEMVAHGEQLSGLEAMAAQLRDFSRKQDGAVTQTLVVSVRERLGKVQQRAAERGAALEEGRKRSKEFMESRRLLLEWMAAVEPGLAEPPEAAGTREEIKGQLAQHKAFQRLLRAKRPMYEATVRSGRALREAAQSPRDRPPLEELLGELKEKWDGMWSRAAERQQKLEENLLFSGKMTEALQALMDWLYWAEPQLSEDVPVGGDRDLVGDLMDKHKVFQKELGKRAGSVRMLQRWVRDPGRGGGSGVPDSQWLQQQVEELGARWDLVCSLSLGKQERLEAALRQAEEFHRLVQNFLGRLGESERNLRVWGCPEEEAAAQEGQRQLQEVLESLECQQLELECISWLGEEILTTSHPDAVLTIRSWLTVVKSRFQEVQSWAQHQSERLRAQAAAMAAEREERTRLLEWMGAAEEALGLRDQEPLPQEAEALEELSTQHAVFMEELNRKQPDVEKVTKSGKQKLPTELGPPAARRLATRRRSSGKVPGVPSGVVLGGVEPQPPVLAQVLQRWQQLWLLALDRQYRLETALRRLRELEEFAHFDFGVWRRRYVQWIGQMKSRVLDVFRGIDRDQDGRISQQEFIHGVLASKFPTNVLEMNAVATIFDVNGDGFIDYYEFISTLHPHRDPLRRSADAERIQDEVNRQVAQCNCAKRFQVEQISANRYRFGESQQLRMVRILRSTLMVRVGGGWIALDEFLVKNDPCRVKGRTNLKINEKYLSPETPGATKCAGTPSSPSSKPLSPSRSSSSLSLYTSASAPSSPLARKSVLRRTRSGDRCPRPRGSPLPDGAELQPPAPEETPAPAPPEPPEGSPPESCSPCR